MCRPVPRGGRPRDGSMHLAFISKAEDICLRAAASSELLRYCGIITSYLAVLLAIV
jgi:hypothetical protein